MAVKGARSWTSRLAEDGAAPGRAEVPGLVQRGSGFGPVAVNEPLRYPVVDVMEPVVERASIELDGCPQ